MSKCFITIIKEPRYQFVFLLMQLYPNYLFDKYLLLQKVVTLKIQQANLHLLASVVLILNTQDFNIY